jgi:hypothetical protein
MLTESKKILFVDWDDSRRASRAALLERTGYEVTLRDDYVSVEILDHEADFDLVVLALHDRPELALDYCHRLNGKTPRLPILLLTDHGVFAPAGGLSPSIAGGNPIELIAKIASMLVGSTHIREIQEAFALFQ